ITCKTTQLSAQELFFITQKLSLSSLSRIIYREEVSICLFCRLVGLLPGISGSGDGQFYVRQLLVHLTGVGRLSVRQPLVHISI
ncbi:unnamed protein product, partial [Arabidopsis halleri]